jgi:hypothetical protein
MAGEFRPWVRVLFPTALWHVPSRPVGCDLSFYVDVTIEQRGVSASGLDNRCQGFWVRRLFENSTSRSTSFFRLSRFSA